MTEALSTSVGSASRAHSIARRKSRRRGIIVVWVAITLLVLIAFVGLAIDTAWVNLVGYHLQDIADAAALAGALQVQTSTAAAATHAANVALANKAGGVAIQLVSNPSNASTGDIVIGSYSLATGVFTPTLSSPNAVQILARRTAASPNGALKLNFGPLAGISTSDVSRVATAMVGGTISAGFVILDPSGSGAISLNGNASISVPNGSVVVDSSSSSAISYNGNTSITAKNLYIVGNDTGAAGVLSSGHLGVNAPNVPDPLAALPVPLKGTARNGTAPLLPGYYANGLPSGTLAAGVYYVENGMSASIDATAGVMIYLHSGTISGNGNATLKINPPSTGTYAGISIWQDVTDINTFSMKGNQDMQNTGVLYLPGAGISLKGTPSALGTEVIAKDFSASGNGNITVGSTIPFPVQGHEVFLVR